MSDKLEALLEKMTDLLAAKEMHTKAPANFSTYANLHGSGGIFSTPGIERDVITTHIRPVGIDSRLPIMPSIDLDPRFASLTGISDDIGAEPTYACEDAPTGYMKGCLLTARFGMVRRDTETIDIQDTIMRVNRGEMTDLVLRGRLLGLTDLAPSGLDQSKIMDIVTMAEMVNVGVRTERVLNKQIWQGVVTIANQFPGLDVQIATGQKDADTGTLCPSLDSDVRSFGLKTVGLSIVAELSSIEWNLRNNATKMGLDPVSWIIVMRSGLWHELTEIWPIVYNTNKASVVPTGATMFVDGRENISERDAMRNGMYLDINGTRYDVVLDDGIFEKNSTNSAGIPKGSYASSIYFVPLTIAGGMPVTYRQYVDFRMANAELPFLRGNEPFFWTDNGVFSWAVTSEKWCYKLHLRTEQRVILRTPQLAGRLDNIVYSPLIHLRDADPDSPYWVDGGVSLRTPVATPYATWTSR